MVDCCWRSGENKLIKCQESTVAEGKEKMDAAHAHVITMTAIAPR